MRPIFRFVVAALVLVTLGLFYDQLSTVPHLKELMQHASPAQQHLVIATTSVKEFLEPKPTQAHGELREGEPPVMTAAQTTAIPVPSGDTNREGEDSKTVEPTTAAGQPAPDASKEEEAIQVSATTEVETASSTTSPTTAPTEEAPTDVEPPAGMYDKAVVMGALSTEDVAWATNKLDSWDAFIYIVDNTSTPLHTDRNKGREANVYLSYIIEHYTSLPSTIAFVHSHEKGWPKAWHTDARHYSNVESLNKLNTDFVQKNGYANLRCLPTPGCPEEVQPFREPKDESRTSEIAFAAAWREIFDNDDIPSVVGVACCAQFAVSREQIQKRSREEYIRMHNWLMNTELDDDISGRVFEYLWHIIFGQEAVYCPEVSQCYKDVYNRGVF